MPRLLVFAPCERVVIGGTNDNSASLIALMQGIDATVAFDAAEVAANAKPVLPVQWYVFALWLRLPADGPSRFEQRWDLVAPNGETLLSGVAEFEMTAQYHRQSHRVVGFPVGETGEHQVKLYLKTVGTNQPAELVAEFPLPVSLIVSQDNPNP